MRTALYWLAQQSVVKEINNISNLMKAQDDPLTEEQKEYFNVKLADAKMDETVAEEPEAVQEPAVVVPVHAVYQPEGDHPGRYRGSISGMFLSGLSLRDERSSEHPGGVDGGIRKYIAWNSLYREEEETVWQRYRCNRYTYRREENSPLERMRDCR